MSTRSECGDMYERISMMDVETREASIHSTVVTDDTEHDIHSECQKQCTPLSSPANTLCSDCAARVSRLRIPLVSPLEHLLSNTYRHLPSATETVQVHQVIREANTRMAEIDATSARIRLILEELANERRTIQEYTDKHKVMVAPVWELPPEILSYIFILCLSSRPLLELKRHSLRRSLTMTRINRHWRNVALSTPQLWTTILIDCKPNGREDDPLGIARAILGRSGACPLTIWVSSGDNLEVLDFIMPLAERWERVVFDTPLTMLQALSSVKHRLPLLRALEIKSIRWTDEPQNNHLTFFSDAPRLRHLAISSTFTTSFRVLPWLRLTSFDGPVMVHEFRQIFEIAPELEECFLQPIRTPLGQSIPDFESEFTHNLTYLHISTGVFPHMTLQLHHFPIFPNLRRLFLYYDKRILTNHADQFLVPLFANSGANLEHLTFGVSVSIGTIRRCLTYTPSLINLQIHRVANDILLSILTHPADDDPPLLPKLEILRLSGKIYFRADSVIKLIRARWHDPEDPDNTPGGVHASAEPPKCLREVYILPPRVDKFEADARKQLLAFNNRGFVVQLRSLDRPSFLARTPLSSLIVR